MAEPWRATVDNRSPYDEVPPELMHSGADLEATAEGLNRLAETLLWSAEGALRAAAARQTSESTAEVLRDEAATALRMLLQDPDEVDEIVHPEDDTAEDRAWTESLERALAGTALGSLARADEEWFAMQARDLALATATLWWNLGAAQPDRIAAASRLLEGFDERLGGEVASLAARFGLTSQEARQLLDLARQRSAALDKATSIDWQTAAAAAAQMQRN